MAREILFQGKTKDEKEWIEGFYAVFSNTPFIGAPNHYGTMLWYPVIPETVRQFTGLTDKNGKRIFEGDIIRYKRGNDVYVGAVCFGEYEQQMSFHLGFHVEWASMDASGYFRRDIRFWTVCRDIEVIGNIHDNPELLNGTEP